MTDRQNMIERMVEQYRDDLDEKDDDELLGGTLDMAWLGASAYAKIYLTDPEAVEAVSSRFSSVFSSTSPAATWMGRSSDHPWL